MIAANPDRFEVVGLAAGGGNADVLAAQRAADRGHQHRRRRSGGRRSDSVTSATPVPTRRPASSRRPPRRDVVLNGLVGALGLKPTLAALASGARLALANKESLVAGGPLVLKAAAPGQIVPVDSEHSALAQCLRSGGPDEVARLVLTASGGPFRGWSAADLESVTPEQAGAHPTWSMGPMNTLNSASLVNKGLELIETHLLFGIDYDRIDVVVHPQSIVHSMVTFTDGSTIAQASPPDMKLPIALALGWPARVAGCGRGLRLHHGVHLGIRAAGRRGVPGRRPGPARRSDGWLHDRGLQRRQRRSSRGVPRAAASRSRRSCEPSPTCCALRTNGPPNRLPWTMYSTRNAGPGQAQGLTRRAPSAQEVVPTR